MQEPAIVLKRRNTYTHIKTNTKQTPWPCAGHVYTTALIGHRNQWNIRATGQAFNSVQVRLLRGQLHSWHARPCGEWTRLQKHLQDNVQPTTVPWPSRQFSKCLNPLNQAIAFTKCFHQAASGVAGEFLAEREAHRGKSSVPVCLWKCQQKHLLVGPHWPKGKHLFCWNKTLSFENVRWWNHHRIRSSLPLGLRELWSPISSSISPLGGAVLTVTSLLLTDVLILQSCNILQSWGDKYI